MNRTTPALPTTESPRFAADNAESGVSECLDRLAARRREGRPLGTYRLQFNKDFTFQHARALIPYLKDLGVSHCYASPLLKARSGSQHGYDIINHNELNPEIGSEDEFRLFASELKAAGMGLLLDIVPNHMGVGQGSNPWWQDVLEHGRSSPHSDYFDIDWRSLRDELQGKVLLPVLGSSYGEELEHGRLQVRYEDGWFLLHYYDLRLPLDPRSVPLILEAAGEFQPRPPHAGNRDVDLEEFEAIGRELAQLPPHSSEEPEAMHLRQREAPRLRLRLGRLTGRSAQVAALLARAVKAINGAESDSRSFDALHRLLEAQAYRLANWRVSAEEINYRRFFDVNDLVGLRMENPAVFAATHHLIRKLLAEGCVSGLRIDHPDGLLNPPQYFTRLQMLYAASQCFGPAARGALAENGIESSLQQVWGGHDWIGEGAPLFVAVEKILEHGEELPAEWPVDGTVGYEFANLVNGLFIDARSQRAFTTLYHRVLDYTPNVADIIYESKKLIMQSAMSGEVAVLTHTLGEISSADRHARDFTRKSLGDAVREVIACFPVYRTYIDERGHISERDQAYIHDAIVRAKRRNASTPAAIFDFVRSVLLITPDSKNTIEGRRRRLYFTLKFQQLTGPVMAKGLEDTACYVYNRFVSVNEVGGTPRAFGVSADEFHAANMERMRRWPDSMLATSTHDTKRSEDVRARLNVLSEMPREWARHVNRWRRINRARKPVLPDGRAVPDANEEYLLYQTLIGMWPGRAAGRAEFEACMERLRQYMTKAVHEAKVNLSWVNPDPAYIEALGTFLRGILQPGPGRQSAFLDQLNTLLEPVTYFGALNSIAQTLLKLTVPGIPDIYQGNELWDFSLVDPDNRRPVDFERRSKALAELQTPAGDDIALCRRLFESWAEGAIKMFVTMRALTLRRRFPELFRSGAYTPLFAAQGAAEHVCAFARELASAPRQIAVVAVPRLSYTLMRGRMQPPIGEVWKETELALPPRAPAEFANIFTSEVLHATPGRGLLCREVFAHLPVALLVNPLPVA